MRPFALKFAIVLFAALLGWTSANAETCTHIKERCLADRTCTTEYCQKVLCKDRWEQCMKSGFWHGPFTSRPAEKR
jgi:hypothetical protein